MEEALLLGGRQATRDTCGGELAQLSNRRAHFAHVDALRAVSWRLAAGARTDSARGTQDAARVVNRRLTYPCCAGPASTRRALQSPCLHPRSSQGEVKRRWLHLPRLYRVPSAQWPIASVVATCLR